MTRLQLSDALRAMMVDPKLRDVLSEHDRSVLREADRMIMKDNDPFADALASMFSSKAEDHVILASYKDEIMTLHHASGKMMKYHGSGTVWHRMPMMERCSTEKEKALASFHAYIKKWGNPYPNAHLNASGQ